MLESLLLKDFMPHRRTLIEFAPGVTCLVGDSDAGKSSALHGLEWVLTNRPQGTAMVGRFGAAPFALARLALDGHTLSRKRGKGVNSYAVDGEILPSPGTGAPGPVADVANVGPANFQNQFDGPYWFLLTPGEVSRRLNSIVNLTLIDAALANAAARVRKATAAVAACRERLKAHKEKKRLTAWAAEADRLLTRAERVEAEKDRLARRSHRIAQAARSIRDAAALAKTAESRSRAIVAQIRAYRKALALAERRDRLKAALAEIRRLRAVAASAPAVSPAALRAAYEKYRVAAGRRQRLGSLSLQINQCEYDLALLDAEAAGLRKTLDGVQTCPLCNQPLGNRRPSAPRTGT